MANLPILGRNPSSLTMSSREIAELTEKRHDHVMRDIRVMLIELYGENDLPKFGGVYLGGNGEERPCFNLPRREVEILVTGYSIPLRAKVIDRLHALEEQAAQTPFIIPPDYASALRLAADTLDKNTALEAQIEADKPKVEFAMAVRNMDDTCTIEEFAKTLGTGRNRFFKWLRAQEILLRNNLPYQRYIDCGWFKVVELKPWIDKEGNAHPEFSARITGKGQVGLESRYRNEERQGLVLIAGGAP